MRKSLLITLEFPPQKGGTQSYYFNICKNLPAEKIVVLAPNNDKLCSNPSAGGGVDGAVNFKIYRKNLLVKYLYPHWLPMVWRLYGIIKKEKIELVQVGQVLPCGTAAFLINKCFTTPYIVYTHGLDVLRPQKNQSKKNLMIKILRNAEKVISNSEFTKNEVAKLGIDRNKIFVVYPNVENPKTLLLQKEEARRTLPQSLRGRGDGEPSPSLSAGGGAANPPREGSSSAPSQSPSRDCGVSLHFPPASPQEGENFDELRKKYNLAGKKILLTVCRLVERKGVDLVVNALADFSEELKDVIYVVVGDGPKIDGLKRLAASKGWQPPNVYPQVIFIGQVSGEELDLWYRMSDIFILTPKKSEFDVEGFGIVYIEAGSYSKPVIGSRLGGICEAVEDGVTGILVDPNNVEQIGQAIVRLFGDEELKERLGRRGRELVEKEFCVEKQMRRLMEAME